MGCDAIKYRSYRRACDSQDESGYYPHDVCVYPDGSRESLSNSLAGLAPDEASAIPLTVRKMFDETIRAIAANAKTLAGGGLRATVEAICIDKGIPGRDLSSKIDRLAEEKFLTESQAELLHEERYLGNAALHELATPSDRDLADGLQIVESLIRSIYVLPIIAGRLRASRTARTSKDPKSTG